MTPYPGNAIYVFDNKLPTRIKFVRATFSTSTVSEINPPFRVFRRHDECPEIGNGPCSEGAEPGTPFGSAITHSFGHPQILCVMTVPITFNWVALVL